MMHKLESLHMSYDYVVVDSLSIAAPIVCGHYVFRFCFVIIGVAPITHVRNKIVTFKGGHLMW